MVSLRLFCLEASELHTGLPTLWPEGDSMDLATRTKWRQRSQSVVIRKAECREMRFAA